MMDREFIEAEESIANSFREGTIRLDRSSITINDVGGIKILGTQEQLAKIEEALRKRSVHPCREAGDFLRKL